MVKSKWGLALAAVVTVLSSLLMSVGLCTLFVLKRLWEEQSGWGPCSQQDRAQHSLLIASVSGRWGERESGAATQGKAVLCQ